ncbi:low temperature requirement protein A [Micromonospora sp. C28SCA-DRY-2]|uniref:low temperature requirement protein A n=1 Tax=Micromonospora sp. C28SCA-DRY-2 TaxID=3059522 RepID=UPI002677581D|nr:low temperature requirement protein A [Micromonospora sp. C28SCA-DRY-2]MDO3703558.1 low temperature requirement protein A [Micromonospora sp. C28SCA-DRY-2]
MTAGNTGELLRDHAEPQRATYVELFFDVILVFAFTRLSHTLFTDLTWLGALHTVILLAAFWWVWVFTAWTTNRLNPAQPAIQLVIIPIMLGTLVMAGAVPEAFGEDGMVFAVTYVTIQVGRALFVTVTMRGRGEVAIGSLQQLIWFCLSGALWIAGALTEGTSRVVIWFLAAALGYTMSRLEFRLPRLGPARIATQTVSAEHLAERYQQIMIVAFGETVLASGGQFAVRGFERDSVIAFVLAFATTTLMWRIYFYRAGLLLPGVIAASTAPAVFARSASYAHLLMTGGIVLSAVGDEIVITHAFAEANLVWSSVILCGPAIYLAGRARLDYLSFSRVALSRVIGLVVLVVLAPVVAFLSPIYIAVVAIVILSTIAVSDTISWRFRPSRLAPPPPPRGRYLRP